MGGGFYLFKFFGVAADWLLGNLWRKLRGKPIKTYKEIWDGDAKGDDLDGYGYNIFYTVIGIGALVLTIWLLASIFPSIF